MIFWAALVAAGHYWLHRDTHRIERSDRRYARRHRYL